MLKNINATINADSTNLAPIGVVKVEDTVLLNLKVTTAGELIDFTGQDIYISALRTDNSLVQQESFISIDKTNVIIQLNKEFNCVAGITQMELTAKDQMGMTTTANFYIRVNSRIMSIETMKGTGYIETLEKVKLEFLEELNIIKENFNAEKENKFSDFTVQTQTAIDNFIEHTNTVIKEFNVNANKELEEINKKAQNNINIAIDNFNKEFNKVAAEFNVSATREIEDIKVNADNTNLNAIDKFNTTNTEFINKSNLALSNFNAEANKQLQEQKVKFDALINEQKITEWEERLTTLEKHHEPVEPVPIVTESGEYILTEDGVIMLKEK